MPVAPSGSRCKNVLPVSGSVNARLRQPSPSSHSVTAAAPRFVRNTKSASRQNATASRRRADTEALLEERVFPLLLFDFIVNYSTLLKQSRRDSGSAILESLKAH